jgi:hypothetical protein
MDGKRGVHTGSSQEMKLLVSMIGACSTQVSVLDSLGYAGGKQGGDPLFRKRSVLGIVYSYSFRFGPALHQHSQSCPHLSIIRTKREHSSHPHRAYAGKRERFTKYVIVRGPDYVRHLTAPFGSSMYGPPIWF